MSIEENLQGTETCTFPVGALRDEGRRQEFLQEYTRLVDRCGLAAMWVTFSYYLDEQDFDNGKRPEPSKGGKRILNVGHANTAVVLARLVEKGRMNYYLSPDPIPEQRIRTVVYLNDVIREYEFQDNGRTLHVTHHNKDSERLAKHYDNLLPVIGKSTLIQPDEIRAVFAQIDKQYDRAA